jgi:microcystin-dependent protein
MEPLMGTVIPFAPGWAPKGWMACDGRLLPIAQYSALFSLLGTQYGGDGIQTFALPKIDNLNTSNSQGSLLVIIAVEGIYPSRAS